MPSEEIKEEIVFYFENKVKTNVKDWKRVSKSMISGGITLREFTNKKINRNVYTLGDEDVSIVEKDVWIFGIARETENSDSFYISFEPLDRWNRERKLYDQHQSDIIEYLFGLTEFEEICENMFLPPDGMNETSARTAVENCGFVYNKEFSDFLMNINNKDLIALLPIAPINPPTPCVIEKNQTDEQSDNLDQNLKF